MHNKQHAEAIRASLERELAELAARCKAVDMVPRIHTVPLLPLAMGNYEFDVSVTLHGTRYRLPK